MKHLSLCLFVLAILGCGNKSEVPPPESFKCETAADCRVSCVERGDCCGDPCDCKTPYHRDELEQVQAANRKSCPEPNDCPVADCAPPEHRYLPACEEGRCAVRAAPIAR